MPFRRLDVPPPIMPLTSVSQVALEKSQIALVGACEAGLPLPFTR